MVLKRGVSYTKLPSQLQGIKAETNLQNKYDKGFRYAVVVGLNHESILNHLERTELQTFFHLYKNITGKIFSSGKKVGIDF